MYTERSRPRIAPKDFADYAVNIKLPGLKCDGFLGNISEDGLCAIVPFEGPLGSEPGTEITGEITSRRLAGPLAFQGRLAWVSSSSIHDRPHLLLGIEFKARMDLPDNLLALGLMTDDDA
ncbi:MAG: PilZ domain-containing protein [Spirochaetia bacterium]|nr:PilZ domain-containing protein [Spirochaetia bacterium]